MRLIDADELISFIKFNGYVYANTLERFPKVDAVPVVRCNKCRYWIEQWNHTYKCFLTERVTSSDDFCSDGED